MVRLAIPVFDTLNADIFQNVSRTYGLGRTVSQLPPARGNRKPVTTEAAVHAEMLNLPSRARESHCRSAAPKACGNTCNSLNKLLTDLVSFPNPLRRLVVSKRDDQEANDLRVAIRQLNRLPAYCENARDPAAEGRRCVRRQSEVAVKRHDARRWPASRKGRLARILICSTRVKSRVGG